MAQTKSFNEPILGPATQKLRYLSELCKYVAINKADAFKTLCAHIVKFDEVAVDTETTGLDIQTANIRGYSLAVETNKAFWVPIKADPQLKWLRKVTKGRKLVFFNAGYDLAVIERHIGRELPNAFVDVQIGCFFRDVNNYKHNAGLKTQSQIVLNRPTVELKEIIEENEGVTVVEGATKKKKIVIEFDKLTEWQQCIYGCQDADITLQLWRHKEIQNGIATMPDIFELEHRLIRVVMQMHANGLAIDSKKLAQFGVILDEECKNCVIEATRLLTTGKNAIGKRDVKTGKVTFNDSELQRLTAKKGLNLGSATQKRIILFGELKLPLSCRAGYGEGTSTNSEALTNIRDKHPLVPILLRYSKLSTRNNIYVKKLPGLIHPLTGRIHPTLWATGIKSGRFSCSNPNLQAVSRDQETDSAVHIREVFVPGKGKVLTVADYNQIELRIAASIAQETVLLDAYFNGEDVHSKMACKLFTVTEPTKVQRQVAKVANFSILTGIGPVVFSMRNRDLVGNEDSAAKIIGDWFTALPQMKQWIDRAKLEAHHDGYAATFFGRIRPFPDINRPNATLVQQRINAYRLELWSEDYSDADLKEIAIRSLIAGMERKAVSHVIQGTAADIMKVVLVKVSKAIAKSGLDIKLLLTVHDELLFEHPPKITKKVQKLVTETMTIQKLDEGWVPLPIAINTGKSWAQAK